MKKICQSTVCMKHCFIRCIGMWWHVYFPLPAIKSFKMDFWLACYVSVSASDCPAYWVLTRFKLWQPPVIQYICFNLHLETAQKCTWFIFCLSDIQQILERMNTTFEMCWKKLLGYLEHRRSRFPRFYFLSTKDLLHVICNGIMISMCKCMHFS